MKPFDLEKAKAGAKLVTRDGREVTYFSFDEETNMYPCTIHTVDGEYDITEYGTEWYSDNLQSNQDIFLAD